MKYAVRHILFLSVSALLIAVTGNGEAAVISIKKNVTVGASVVRLGDVADVFDSDRNKVEQLKSIMISPAPGPGRGIRLNFATIRSRMQALGVSLANMEFTGSNVVLVSSTLAAPGGPRTAEAKISDRDYQRATKAVAKSVEQYLSQKFPKLGKVNVSVQLRGQQIAKILEAAVTGYEVRGGQAPWNQPQQMVIRFLDHREQLHEEKIICRLSPRPYVLVAKYTVPRGHVFQKLDMAWQQISGESVGFDRLENVIGREATRTVREGEVIQTQDIQTVPLVRSNDIVSVYSRASGITVKRQLKSRSEGAIGDTVTLVTLDGRQRILARVTGYHEAEVVGSRGPNAGGVRDATGSIRFVPARTNR